MVVSIPSALAAASISASDWADEIAVVTISDAAVRESAFPANLNMSVSPLNWRRWRLRCGIPVL